MSTPSSIIVECADGKWALVYCHWDGYPSHHGPILCGHYATQELAEALVKPGDISLLEIRCDKPDGHTFDNPVQDCTIYYGRDRGEKNVLPEIYMTLSAALACAHNFVYLWQRDRAAWFIKTESGSFLPLDSFAQRSERK